MSEGVDVVAHGHLDAEAVEEVALAEDGVPRQGFPRRDVAVWLFPPAAHDDPAALPDPLGDALEQLGLILLDPLVGGGGAAAKDEA